MKRTAGRYLPFTSAGKLVKADYGKFVPEFKRLVRRHDRADGLVHEARIAGLSNEEVLARLRHAQVPCGPVLDTAGVVADEHVKARATLMPTVDPVIGAMLQTRMPVGPGDTPKPAPLLGEHSHEVLAELGFGDGEISEMFATGVLV